MMKTAVFRALWIGVGIIGCLTASAADSQRIVRWRSADPAADLPEDLREPEGRTRWDLTRLTLSDKVWIRETELVRGHGTRVDTSPDGALSAQTVVLTDPLEGDAVERWWMPDRAPELLDALRTHRSRLRETFGSGENNDIEVSTRRAGLGWVHLPAGPRQAILQQVRIDRIGAGPGATARDGYRWIDPRAGVVAEVWGTRATGGSGRLEIDEIAIVESVELGVTGLRVYSDQVVAPFFSSVNYGWNRNLTQSSTITVDSVAPGPQSTIWDLACSPHPTSGACQVHAWDFSGNNPTNFPGMPEWGTTTTPVNAAETCNWNQCGFSLPGVTLGREDLSFEADPPTRRSTLNVTEAEQRAGDVTIWMRAVARNEGVNGSLGSGESRICYSGGGRTEVPLFRFSNPDGSDWYMDLGDSWSHTPFQCENNIFNHVCPNSCSTFCPFWIKACMSYSGTQGSSVVNEGVVTLPSGHTFEVLVIRSVAEFCTYGGSSCLFNLASVRTVNYLWQAPLLGTITRLQSVQNASSTQDYTVLAETDFKFGLFPPRTISVTGATTNSLSITWDPGLDTHRIIGYRVYWDTDSGADSPYAFSSVNHPGQISIVGTAATLTGLAPSTSYFLTVTAISDYTDPATDVTTTYESLVYPIQVGANPNPIPAEVQAMTAACIPTEEVPKTMVGRRVGSGSEFCWTQVTDICAQGYRILGANNPSAAANFSVVVSDTGNTNCATFDSPFTYYLVISHSSAGTGPWGHYGQ